MGHRPNEHPEQHAASQVVHQVRGDPNGADAFDPSIEWDGFAEDTVEFLGSHSVTDAAPSAHLDPSTLPMARLTSQLTANVEITFSEPVNATGSWFTISCGASGAHTATVGVWAHVYVHPGSGRGLQLRAEVCTVTAIVATQVTDLEDESDPPDAMSGY